MCRVLTAPVLLAFVSCIALPASAAGVSHRGRNPPVPISRTLSEDLEYTDAVAKRGDATGAIKLYEAAAARARGEHKPVLEAQAPIE